MLALKIDSVDDLHCLGEWFISCNHFLVDAAQLEYNEWIMKDKRTIVAVLEDLPSFKPPLDHLLELLPRLQARYYSISSSSKVSPLACDLHPSSPFLPFPLSSPFSFSPPNHFCFPPPRSFFLCPTHFWSDQLYALKICILIKVHQWPFPLSSDVP